MPWSRSAGLGIELRELPVTQEGAQPHDLDHAFETASQDRADAMTRDREHSLLRAASPDRRPRACIIGCRPSTLRARTRTGPAYGLRSE